MNKRRNKKTAVFLSALFLITSCVSTQGGAETYEETELPAEWINLSGLTILTPENLPVITEKNVIGGSACASNGFEYEELHMYSEKKGDIRGQRGILGKTPDLSVSIGSARYEARCSLYQENEDGTITYGWNIITCDMDGNQVKLLSTVLYNQAADGMGLRMFISGSDILLSWEDCNLGYQSKRVPIFGGSESMEGLVKEYQTTDGKNVVYKGYDDMTHIMPEDRSYHNWIAIESYQDIYFVRNSLVYIPTEGDCLTVYDFVTGMTEHVPWILVNENSFLSFNDANVYTSYQEEYDEKIMISRWNLDTYESDTLFYMEEGELKEFYAAKDFLFFTWETEEVSRYQDQNGIYMSRLGTYAYNMCTGETYLLGAFDQTEEILKEWEEAEKEAETEEETTEEETTEEETTEEETTEEETTEVETTEEETTEEETTEEITTEEETTEEITTEEETTEEETTEVETTEEETTEEETTEEITTEEETTEEITTEEETTEEITTEEETTEEETTEEETTEEETTEEETTEEITTEEETTEEETTEEETTEEETTEEKKNLWGALFGETEASSEKMEVEETAEISSEEDETNEGASKNQSFFDAMNRAKNQNKDMEETVSEDNVKLVEAEIEKLIEAGVWSEEVDAVDKTAYITREQFLVLLLNCLNMDDLEETSEQDNEREWFDDVEDERWSYAEIRLAVLLGMIEMEEYFYPEENVEIETAMLWLEKAEEIRDAKTEESEEIIAESATEEKEETESKSEEETEAESETEDESKDEYLTIEQAIERIADMM